MGAPGWRLRRTRQPRSTSGPDAWLTATASIAPRSPSRYARSARLAAPTSRRRRRGAGRRRGAMTATRSSGSAVQPLACTTPSSSARTMNGPAGGRWVAWFTARAGAPARGGHQQRRGVCGGQGGGGGEGVRQRLVAEAERRAVGLDEPGGDGARAGDRDLLTDDRAHGELRAVDGAGDAASRGRRDE